MPGPRQIWILPRVQKRMLDPVFTVFFHSFGGPQKSKVSLIKGWWSWECVSCFGGSPRSDSHDLFFFVVFVERSGDSYPAGPTTWPLHEFTPLIKESCFFAHQLLETRETVACLFCTRLANPNLPELGIEDIKNVVTWTQYSLFYRELDRPFRDSRFISNSPSKNQSQIGW